MLAMTRHLGRDCLNYKGTIVSLLRDTLNDIIATSERQRNLEMPRIGVGHAGIRGGIFSLLQDPGNSGAEKSRFVSVHNKDQTAKWCKKTFEKLNIQLPYVTPWNAIGTYCEKTNVRGS